jgi:hypothetical protein
MVNAREGEMFLNARDQQTLFDWIKSGNLGGNGGNVYIENFSGNSEDLERFERLYKELRQGGRI